MTGPLAYSPPGFDAPIDLDLSKNEGRPPRDATLAELAVPPQELARYPDYTELQCALADRYGLPPEQLLVTAGGDDALLRLCTMTLAQGGEALVATPTFEMIERYVALGPGRLVEVPWPEGPFPTGTFLAAATEQTQVAFVVSPNNPTGAVATADDLARIAQALPDAIVVLDAAYTEFADDDLTARALELANVVVVRTLSKAWGLAGLRVGCAIGAPALLARLRACGNPMPVSIASARCALRRLRNGSADLAGHVARARLERAALASLLERLGARPARPSQGNFVLARGVDPGWLVPALAALGIAVRRFPDRAELRDAVRVTVPGDADAFARVEAALTAALAPQALLFDMDGVLVDVSGSYRVAIADTAATFGVDVTAADIAAAKARGGANDDWQLTRSLMAARGVEIPLDEVTERFEQRYRALRDLETAMVDRATLARWRRRFRLGVVTGRPRSDARYFLDRSGLGDLFDAVICREDAPLKPDPAPVRLALERLGVRAAWMLGDTTDDAAAARAAGVVPIAVGGPVAACAATLSATEDLEGLLP